MLLGSSLEAASVRPCLGIQRCLQQAVGCLYLLKADLSLVGLGPGSGSALPLCFLVWE